MVSQEPHVLRRDDGGIVTLTLNRPAKLNPLSEDMLAALQETWDDLSEDKSARVIIIQGAGRAFCAGHYLNEMRANPDFDYQQRLFRTCSETMLSIVKLPQPVIAKVHGIATAAGCQLVASCDLAIASEDARFAASGVNIGLFCSTPCVALSRNVSRKHALELLMTGEFITAPRAFELGLLNHVVPADELDATTLALATALLSKSPGVLAAGKRTFYRQLEMGISDAYDFASSEMARGMMTPDAAEGIDAFIEKREPVWPE